MSEYVARDGRRIWASARVFVRMNDMPYGVWIDETGGEVMYNRSYTPIWKRAGRGATATTASEADRNGKWVDGYFLYDDGTSETRRWRAAAALMVAWGLPVPKATDAKKAVVSP